MAGPMKVSELDSRAPTMAKDDAAAPRGWRELLGKPVATRRAVERCLISPAFS
jgi:hypothetical protein